MCRPGRANYRLFRLSNTASCGRCLISVHCCVQNRQAVVCGSPSAGRSFDAPSASQRVVWPAFEMMAGFLGPASWFDLMNSRWIAIFTICLTLTACAAGSSMPVVGVLLAATALVLPHLARSSVTRSSVARSSGARPASPPVVAIRGLPVVDGGDRAAAGSAGALFPRMTCSSPRQNAAGLAALSGSWSESRPKAVFARVALTLGLSPGGLLLTRCFQCGTLSLVL